MLPFKSISSNDTGKSDLIFKKCSICSTYESDSSLITVGSFRQTSDGFVVVYTDGSCVGNGRRNPQAGVGIFLGPESTLNISRKLPSTYEQTNNNAEIVAVTIALHLCKQNYQNKVEIRTDSKFLLTCLTEYLAVWQENGWNKTNKKPVKNKDELLELGEALTDLVVRWVHVPAHNSDPNSIGNDYADFLARFATL